MSMTGNIAPARPQPGAASAAAPKFRYDIQALRAVAVLLVVVAHLWPSSVIAGGFVGVDVFFVISGYLITAHLWREAHSTRRIDLLGFYARRVRRLVPAYALVLATCVVAATWLLPHQLRLQNLHGIIASALQVENWWLARQATDYWAAGNTATSVQHYWSLSIEEQFYLVWPLAFVAALLLGRRQQRHFRWIIAVLSAITVASFGYSLWFTPGNTAAAYFVTPTRMWELGVGGLLALTLGQRELPRKLRPVLRWAGLGAIGAAVVLFNDQTAFPGYAALLPVAGAAAVLLAADTGSSDPTTAVARSRFMQWAGNTSYSLYLWHWPVIVFAPYVLGQSLQTWQKLALLPVMFLFADLSYRFVEPIMQRGKSLGNFAGTSVKALAAGALVTTLLVGGAFVTLKTTQWLRAQSTAIVPEDMCHGATAMENYVACHQKFAASPNAELLPEDTPWHKQEGACQEVARLNDFAAIRTCTYAENPQGTFVLLGDSHAEHYRTAISEVASNNGWNIIEVILPGCSLTDIRSPKMHGRERHPEFCKDWTAWLTEELKNHTFDAYMVSSFTAQMEFEPAHDAVASIRRSMLKLPGDKPILVVRDVPSVGASVGDLNDCLAINDDPKKCATPRAEALKPDLNVEAAKGVPHAQVVDLSSKFCDRTHCYAVIGGLRVHYDQHHVATRFMRTVAPYLEPALRSVMHQ